MAEEPEEISDPRPESMVDNISEKIHGSGDTSTSSPSDVETREASIPPPLSVDLNNHGLFSASPGRSVQNLFGEGKPDDVSFWKNNQTSSSLLAAATAVWVFFELLEYHLLTLVCHIVIFALGFLFLWSNVTTLYNKRPPNIPEVRLPEDLFVELASALCNEINHAIAMLREIAAARDLRRFLIVVGVLWVLSILGSFVNFLTLFYIAFVIAHVVSVLYNMYDEKIDEFAEKASFEIKKKYAAFNSGVLRGLFHKKNA